MRLVTAARWLAIAGALIGVLLLPVLTIGFQPGLWIPLALWAAAPLPLAWWIGRRIAKDARSRAVLVAGMTVALAFGGWAYWDAFLGPSSRTESLAGLIVIFGPAYQLAWLALTLLLAWILGRRSRRSARISPLP